jgi:RNA polymerase sigma factor (sigma-70 family)
MTNQALIDNLAEHVAGLRRYAFALLGSRQEAEDLVQETLARAIAAAGSFRQTGSLRAWLFSIMHNAFISGVRGRRPLERELDEIRPEMAHPPPQVARLEVRDVLAALQQLPEAQREALILIAVEEFSYEEAARVLGIPLGTLTSRLARGRETLRRVMSGEARPQLRVVGGQR